MTEQELRRTAVIIPPTGRAVLCVWAAVPGLFAAPFVFWQSIVAGAGFCLLWAFLVYCLWARACSLGSLSSCRSAARRFDDTRDGRSRSRVDEAQRRLRALAE